MVEEQLCKKALLTLLDPEPYHSTALCTLHHSVVPMGH